MSSLAVSTTVDQQIVLHQFTPRHSVQARALLGWSRRRLELNAAPRNTHGVRQPRRCARLTNTVIKAMEY